MILSLDFMIFGNGFGLGAPYFAQTFYWLPYTMDGDEKRRGDFYTFMGGFGAQLISRQWTHPNAGETRLIKGRKFRPLHSRRRWLRVEVAWGMKLPKDIDQANAEIRALRRDLDDSLVR